MARVEAEERDRERGREGPELIRDPKLIDEFEKGEQLRCQDIPLEVFRRGAVSYTHLTLPTKLEV